MTVNRAPVFKNIQLRQWERVSSCISLTLRKLITAECYFSGHRSWGREIREYSRYSVNPWMQPRRPGYDLSIPSSIPAPLNWNWLPTKAGAGYSKQSLYTWNFLIIFSLCTDSTTHGCHIPKSFDLHLAPNFSSKITFWVSHQVPVAMETLFRQATPAWMNHPASWHLLLSINQGN